MTLGVRATASGDISTAMLLGRWRNSAGGTGINL